MVRKDTSCERTHTGGTRRGEHGRVFAGRPQPPAQTHSPQFTGRTSLSYVMMGWEASVFPTGSGGCQVAGSCDSGRGHVATGERKMVNRPKDPFLHLWVMVLAEAPQAGGTHKTAALGYFTPVKVGVQSSHPGGYLSYTTLRTPGKPSSLSRTRYPLSTGISPF
jgi:hypothetical protein